jgi:phosphoglycerate kinase
MPFKKLTEHTDDIREKTVFLRLDLNLPIENDVILNDYRLQKSLATVRLLAENGARIVLASHHTRTEQSLRVVYERLQKDFSTISFWEEPAVTDALREKIRTLGAGEIIMLQNIRQFAGEEENSVELSSALASLAEVYVNDAFPVAHRTHASVVGIPKHLPSYAGPLFASEVENLSRALTPAQPFYFILGGAKFSTKMPLIEKFLPLAEKVFVCGALANDFFRARGYAVGKSLLDEMQLSRELALNEKIIIPTDVIVRTEAGKKEERAVTNVGPKDAILDAGPETVAHIAKTIGNAKCILWNGPLGNYENGFIEGTEALARAIAENKAFTIVGGGDTIAAIEKLNLADQFGFLSTAGGAMLDFLAKGTLPGIVALE